MMGIKGPDAISCKGGLGVHVTRGERRILEMKCHLECMKEKLTMLETMLPSSVINSEYPGNVAEGRLNSNETKIDKEDQMCFLQSLAMREKNLRDEIFNMKCKEKEYLNVLSKVKIKENDVEETKQPENNHDLFRTNNTSPMTRKKESTEKEKIFQLEEYSKKLCDSLRSIQHKRRGLSQEAEYLSRELDSIEDYTGLEELETNKLKENECPCGELAKCNSCIICTCSDWEQDLKIGGEEKPEGHKKIEHERVKLVTKKSDCRCLMLASGSYQSSESLEINDIYNCSNISKMQSVMTIETTSIPSTVEDVILGDEEDKIKFSCSCISQDECQKCCEICLCEWEQEYRMKQRLYLDDHDECNLCETCNQERFRGGTDSGIPSSKKLCNKDSKKNLPNIASQLISNSKRRTEEENLIDSKEMLSLIDFSQLHKNLQIGKLKTNIRNLQNKNNILRKWLQDENHQINSKPVKDKIFATLVDKVKQNSILYRPKIWKQPQTEKNPDGGMRTKDLGIGLLVLFLTFLSHLLGSSGILSLPFVLKFVFKILSFFFQICIQVYGYFLIFYDTITESILNYSKVFQNNFQNNNNNNIVHYKSESLSIFI